MMSLDKRTYRKTLRVLRGKRRLRPIFGELQAFLRERYGVEACYFTFKAGVLCVILKTARDFDMLYLGARHGEVWQCEPELAAKFSELASRYKYGGRTARENIRVCCVNLAEELEADLHDKAIAQAAAIIQEKYALYGVWGVFSKRNTAVVFFHTDEVANSPAGKKAITDDYFNIIKQHDEFNILRRAGFSLTFDSKQMLDEKYGGSLQNYFR